MIISEFKIPESSPATPKTGLGTAVNFESGGVGICPAGDSSSGIDVIDADVTVIIHVMRIVASKDQNMCNPSLAGMFVGPTPVLR